MHIDFTAVSRVNDKDVARNIAYSETLQCPQWRAGAPRLAIVGGGASVLDHVATLQYWPGQIWAINGAWRWCQGWDIDAIFYSIDAKPDIAPLASGADLAVLAPRCHPETFRVCGNPCLIGKETYGSTSATTAPIHAIRAGHRELFFFGCEGSFGEMSHAYKDISRDCTLLKVKCNGKEFMTSPQMVIQTEYLGDQIRAAPAVLHDRSCGLLAAYIESPEIDVIAGPRWFAEKHGFKVAA